MLERPRKLSEVAYSSGAAKLEDVRITKKEIPLLRKEQAEASQIDLPVIDLRRRKVRIEGQRATERWSQPIKDVERRVELRFVTG